MQLHQIGALHVLHMHGLAPHRYITTRHAQLLPELAPEPLRPVPDPDPFHRISVVERLPYRVSGIPTCHHTAYVRCPISGTYQVL